MSEWYVKDYIESKRGITTRWHGLFVKDRKAEDAAFMPVMLCRSWGEAHEILGWMRDHPDFEKKALRKLYEKPKRAFAPRNRLPNGVFAVLDAGL